jgi:quercetin dioxygenase-like cupin family protein
MPPLKTFSVFGERVDILVDSLTTKGVSATVVQHVPPGGGPPPHSHSNEEETFTVLDGDFELLRNGEWIPLATGEAFYSPRETIHTFRNIGTTPGRIMIFITPGGFENYLEEISPYSPAADMPAILEISEKYGIEFHMSAGTAG